MSNSTISTTLSSYVTGGHVDSHSVDSQTSTAVTAAAAARSYCRRRRHIYSATGVTVAFGGSIHRRRHRCRRFPSRRRHLC